MINIKSDFVRNINELASILPKPENLSMKKLMFILSFLIISCTKTEKIIEPVDFIYSVNFYPSFADRSEVEITKIGNKGKIKLIIEDEFSQVVDSTVLNEEDFNLFSKELGNISLANTKGSNHNGIDGMTCSNVFYQNGKLNKFSFWSPQRGSDYYVLTDAVVTIIKRKFTGKKYDEYFKRLEKHYKR